MKQIVFLKKINGYTTPESEAGFLRKYGHLECAIDDSKYYTYKDDGFRVIHVAGQPVQIIKMTKQEVLRIKACANIKFGDF